MRSIANMWLQRANESSNIRYRNRDDFKYNRIIDVSKPFPCDDPACGCRPSELVAEAATSMSNMSAPQPRARAVRGFLHCECRFGYIENHCHGRDPYEQRRHDTLVVEFRLGRLTFCQPRCECSTANTSCISYSRMERIRQHNRSISECCRCPKFQSGEVISVALFDPSPDPLVGWDLADPEARYFGHEIVNFFGIVVAVRHHPVMGRHRDRDGADRDNQPHDDGVKVADIAFNPNNRIRIADDQIVAFYRVMGVKKPPSWIEEEEAVSVCISVETMRVSSFLNLSKDHPTVLRRLKALVNIQGIQDSSRFEAATGGWGRNRGRGTRPGLGPILSAFPTTTGFQLAASATAHSQRRPRLIGDGSSLGVNRVESEPSRTCPITHYRCILETEEMPGPQESNVQVLGNADRRRDHLHDAGESATVARAACMMVLHQLFEIESLRDSASDGGEGEDSSFSEMDVEVPLEGMNITRRDEPLLSGLERTRNRFQPTRTQLQVLRNMMVPDVVPEDESSSSRTRRPRPTPSGATTGSAMHVVHGPPGSGKSSLILLALALYLAPFDPYTASLQHREVLAEKMGHVALVCAPSNAAVDSVGRKILEEGLLTASRTQVWLAPETVEHEIQYGFQYPQLLRLGSPSDVSAEMRPFTGMAMLDALEAQLQTYVTELNCALGNCDLKRREIAASEVLVYVTDYKDIFRVVALTAGVGGSSGEVPLTKHNFNKLVPLEPTCSGAHCTFKLEARVKLQRGSQTQTMEDQRLSTAKVLTLKLLNGKPGILRDCQSRLSLQAIGRTRLQPEVEVHVEEGPQAVIVLGTLQSVGASFMRNVTHPFRFTIIDEAGQASDVDALVPLVFNRERETRSASPGWTGDYHSQHDVENTILPSRQPLVLMVGDPNQLPPTVLSDCSNVSRVLQNTLLKRVMEDTTGGVDGVDSNRPVYSFLETQHRCHPDIANVWKEFYSPSLQKLMCNGESVGDKMAFTYLRSRLRLPPVCIFNTSGRLVRPNEDGSTSFRFEHRTESHCDNNWQLSSTAKRLFRPGILDQKASEGSLQHCEWHSLVNEGDAQVCLEILDRICAAYFEHTGVSDSGAECRARSLKILLIAAYKGQMLYLQRVFNDLSGAQTAVVACGALQSLQKALTVEDVLTKDIRVQLSTVDGAQGGEADFVVFSTVRGSQFQEGVGFLADPRRMNVAFSRAKCGLYVVGDTSVLQSSPEWTKIITKNPVKDIFQQPVSVAADVQPTVSETPCGCASQHGRVELACYLHKYMPIGN